MERSERPWIPEIVAIEKSNVSPNSLLDTEVPRSTWSFIFLAQRFNTRSQGLKVIHRTIAGAVIHDDDFVVSMSLFPNRADGLLKKIKPVVGRDHDRKFYHTHHK